MNDAAMRNIISSEFRALQQRMLQQSVTKADLMNMADRILVATATRREQDAIKAMIEDLRSEVKSQQQMIRQHSSHIESLNQNTKTTTSQLGSLWRFVQQ